MRSFFILLVIVACTISCSFSVRAARSGSKWATSSFRKGSLTKTEEEVAGEVDLPSGVSFPHLVRRGSRAFAYIISP
jgi:hypothetical protein